MPKNGIFGCLMSLADALFTTTQQRILGLLFGQPEQSFYTNQLIMLTGSGSGAVQRELRRLETSQLVIVKRIGNQRHYQANSQSPIFPELHGLMIKTVALVEPIRESLAKLAPRVQLAIIYGSVAAGTDKAGSDIDIMLAADNTTLEEVYSALDATEKRLGRKINPTLYTVAEFQARKTALNPFLTNVLNGKHIVLITQDKENVAPGAG